MTQMKPHYNEELKKEIVRLHLQEGRTLQSLVEEYKVSKASVSNWIREYREECRNSPKSKAEYDYMKENLRLKKELAEMQKENEFLKKATAFFAKKID